MTIEIQNNSTRTIRIWEPVHADDTIIDATGATYAAGTVLGRITATGNLTAYVSDAEDGSEVPIAVLQDSLVLAAATAQPCRPIVGGQLRRGDLVAHGVGDLDQGEVDALRDYGIIALATTQLAELDNQ